jgi:hypothetical protein
VIVVERRFVEAEIRRWTNRRLMNGGGDWSTVNTLVDYNKLWVNADFMYSRPVVTVATGQLNYSNIIIVIIC